MKLRLKITKVKPGKGQLPGFKVTNETKTFNVGSYLISPMFHHDISIN